MRLRVKVALITGSGHGMGETERQDVCQGRGSGGGEALFIPLDVNQEEDWQRSRGPVKHAAWARLPQSQITLALQ